VAYSYEQTTAVGGSALVSVPFPYIDKSHVSLYLDGVLATGYSWTNDQTIQMPAPITGGVKQLVSRTTPMAALLAVFQKGKFDETDLNQVNRQHLYLQQEAQDLLERGMLVPLGEDGLTLPTAEARAGYVLGFDEDGNPIPTIATLLPATITALQDASLAAVAAAEEAEASATSAAAALATIGAASISVAGGLLDIVDPDLLDSPEISLNKADNATTATGTSDTTVVTPKVLREEGEHLLVEPSWTGGRKRGLRDLLRDWCRLDQDTQFDPLGVTLMNTLIASAWASYDTIILPKGTALASTIAPPRNNCRLVGEGPSCILKMPNGGNTNLIQATSKSGLRFENFTLEGNRANNSAGNGTDIQGCNDVRFDGVRIVNWFGNGIILQVSCSDIAVVDCLISNVGSHGISLSAVNGATVASNRIIDAALSGVNLGAVGNFVIANNVLTRNAALGATGGGAGGIRTTNTSTVGTITGNTISLYDRGIMLITGAQVTTVSGNTIIQPWYDGIFIQGTVPLPGLDIAVTGNVITNANQSNSGSYDGIRIDGSVGALLTKSNVIRDGRGSPQMQYGIRDTSTGAGSNLGRNATDNWIGGAAVAAVN